MGQVYGARASKEQKGVFYMDGGGRLRSFGNILVFPRPPSQKLLLNSLVLILQPLH
jgi:hypothetical protein